jgi:tRNA pseudouridine38-40 synthase
MHRYFIKISFDGTRYNGWQVQKNSAETVQQKINDGLSRLLGEKIEVYGCCRTDTGVHAKELFAHFDSTKESLHIKKEADWLYKFNKMIPTDISIDRIFQVKETANARYDATLRVYNYFIHPKRNPFLEGRSYHYYSELNLELMNRAAKLLMKHNDFSAFSKMNTQVKTNICKIKKAEWKRDKEGNLVFVISADRFLRGMVRMIVGTMLLLGKDKIGIEDFKEILESKDCRNAGALAPACGLYLVKVDYPKKIFLS